MKTRSAHAKESYRVKVDIPGDIARQGSLRMPHLPVSERRRNLKEVELGYNAETAMAEAKRCLNCAVTFAGMSVLTTLPNLGLRKNQGCKNAIFVQTDGLKIRNLSALMPALCAHWMPALSMR